MTLLRTRIFRVWLDSMRDHKAKIIIARRLTRLANGNPGDFRSVGSGVLELRIDYGPGFRVYYIQRGKKLIVLLCGGDKDTQQNDIARAKELAEQLDLEV